MSTLVDARTRTSDWPGSILHEDNHLELEGKIFQLCVPPHYWLETLLDRLWLRVRVPVHDQDPVYLVINLPAHLLLNILLLLPLSLGQWLVDHGGLAVSQPRWFLRVLLVVDSLGHEWSLIHRLFLL